jgi:hypothetical protein
VSTYGYFVGPAKRIVGDHRGRKVNACLAPWSEDPRVVIFWFHPDDLRLGVRFDGILAYDSAGRKL